MPLEFHELTSPLWSMSALGKFGYLMRRRIRLDSGGAAVEYIDDKIVGSGRMLNIVRVSVENETNDYTELRIGVLSSGIFHPHEEEKNPNAGSLYWTSEEFYLGEGEKLRIELTGTTDADIIWAYIELYEARIIR